jgi:hypothetical protein
MASPVVPFGASPPDVASDEAASNVPPSDRPASSPDEPALPLDELLPQAARASTVNMTGKRTRSSLTELDLARDAPPSSASKELSGSDPDIRRRHEGEIPWP